MDKKIRILILIHNLEFGGTQRYLVHLMKGLDQNLFIPQIWSFSRENDMAPLIDELNIPVRYLSKGRWVGFMALVRLACGLILEKPDILYTLTENTNKWGRILGALFCDSIIVSSWRNRRPRQFERMLWPLSRHIICNARVLRNDLVFRYHVAPGRISVIPNAVDTNYYLPDKEQTSDKPSIVFVGRLAVQKDPFTLIESFRQVSLKIPEARFEIVGNGPLGKKISALVKKTSLDSKVRMINGKHDIRPNLQRAWVFVLSSSWEGSPNVILEAMASGLPVVATRVDGIPELITHGQTGLLVDPGQPKKLADALIRLIEDEGLRTLMGKRARKEVVNFHSPRQMVQSTQKVFLEAMITRAKEFRQGDII
jgi:L-malate glycosyltransferase